MPNLAVSLEDSARNVPDTDAVAGGPTWLVAEPHRLATAVERFLNTVTPR